MTIALATPALRPAAYQELPLSPISTLHRPAGFSEFSQPVTHSPSGTPRLSVLQGSGTPTGSRTPTGGSRGEGDYFSLIPNAGSSTSLVAPSVKTPEVPLPSPTPTPGLMNRFRFGKSSKRPTTGDAAPTKTVPVASVSAADHRVVSKCSHLPQILLVSLTSSFFQF